jgi:hypothetical protein
MHHVGPAQIVSPSVLYASCISLTRAALLPRIGDGSVAVGLKDRNSASTWKILNEMIRIATHQQSMKKAPRTAMGFVGYAEVYPYTPCRSRADHIAIHPVCFMYIPDNLGRRSQSCVFWQWYPSSFNKGLVIKLIHQCCSCDQAQENQRDRNFVVRKWCTLYIYIYMW